MMLKSLMNPTKIVFAASLFAGSAAAASGHAVPWVNLLEKDSLEDWTLKFAGQPLNENYKDTVQVKDGVLKVSYDAYNKFAGEFGHIFYNTPYSHYRLKFEYRFTGEQTPSAPRWAFRNSGVMVHSQSPDSMTLEQEFPVSIEVQLLGQVGQKKRPTGNVCTPGTHIVLAGKLEKEHCIYSSSKTYPGDDWVAAEVEVAGGRLIKHFINGEMVMEYTAPQLDASEIDTQKLLASGIKDTLLESGYIAFQAESHPVEFKNIKLQILEK